MIIKVLNTKENNNGSSSSNNNNKKKGTKKVDLLLCPMSFRNNTKVGLVQWRNQLVSNAAVHARRRRLEQKGKGETNNRKEQTHEAAAATAVGAAGARLIICIPPLKPLLAIPLV